MLTFVAVELATRRIHNSTTKKVQKTHADLAVKDYYVTIFLNQIIRGGGALGVAPQSEFSRFFLENQKKWFIISP